ncbi:MAG TPA: NUDIX hydrolase [Chitinophagaceae bacterium]|jgi:8-oxo-dGTP pyrophosphatase MutT (NUDIX family)|nr:NUDIX hydrolase [Chitinophagaceae bacterium]
MYIKIYFNDKPLFLCDEVDKTIEPYIHHDDAIFIDEFSIHSIKSMIHEMQLQKIHAGVYLYTSLDELKKAFFKKFIIVKAAGGLVLNKNKEMLMIFRRGKWDLPKGKLDKGETLEQCALREVEEETGLKNISLHNHLLTTYHTYLESGKFILKESHWYNMTIQDEQQLVPQAEEQIAEARWVDKTRMEELLKNTFPSVKDVLEKAASHVL